jgi:ABC-type transport system involved in multi-copper enzyme maturation permease subunit
MKNINLLQIEFLKFSNSRSITLLLVFLLINGITQYVVYGFAAGTSQFTEPGTVNEVAEAYHTYFGSTSFLPSIFVVLLIIANMGNEFMQGTLRRNIIDGYSRSDFFLGKLYSMLLVSALILLLAMAEMVVVGLRFGHSAGDLLPSFHLSDLIRWLVLFSAYAMIGLFIVTLVRNSTTGIVLFLGSMVAEKMLSVIDTFSASIDFNDFLPYYVIDQIVSVANLTWAQIILIAIYMLVLMGASLFLLLKKDL